MKFIIFASAYDIDEIHKDINYLDEGIGVDFNLLKLTCEEDYINGFGLIEMRGSYAFISEEKYNEINKKWG